MGLTALLSRRRLLTKLYDQCLIKDTRSIPTACENPMRGAFSPLEATHQPVKTVAITPSNFPNYSGYLPLHTTSGALAATASADSLHDHKSFFFFISSASASPLPPSPLSTTIAAAAPGVPVTVSRHGSYFSAFASFSKTLSSRNLLSRPARVSVRAPHTTLQIDLRRFFSNYYAKMAELQWPGAKVRETFFKYFEERGHTIVPSSSVVPHDDPTLLFTNAGMNQFKPIFLGTVNKGSEMANLKRAVDTQKCIRAGGKHNDLDDVGKDSYHHTFFEMLGNWSFGDYFKKEAIQMSWELLTKVYGLDPTRIYVTYFEGNAEYNLEPDLEAKQLWLDVGVPEDHILPGNMKDNFWEMGDQGPCGPCSEVHYDKIGGRNAASLVNMDDPMVVEIWNNVFMQYDRQKDKSLKPLPAKHIDTGMGFERLVSALQNTVSNYATDIFTPLFAQIHTVTGARPYTDKYGKDDADGIDTAYRVVSDHIRLLSFSITDGAVPNNDGRGYVVRRVLRRGVRYARKYFNAEIGSFFSKILPALVEQMGAQFPELVKKQADIKEILDEEEVAFARTLDRGEVQFEKFASEALKKGEKELSGEVVWRLYDTYGFPLDLTKLMAEERNLDIDEAEVEVARERAREASKVVKQNTQTFSKLDVHQISELDSLKVPRTIDEPKYQKPDVKVTAKVQFIYDGKTFVKSSKDIPANTPIGLLLDQTNFYAESGGQVADTGRIVIDGVVTFEVVDVQSYGGYILHNGYLHEGVLNADDEVICEYDELRRAPIRNNHTGTHILNHSLREVLGDEVHQKGSLVDNDKLRFDFSNKTGISIPDLAKIEDLSNRYIRADKAVYYKDVDLDAAREITSLRAVFGETYPNPVRVVSIGAPVEDLLANPKNPEWNKLSIEFCGGTHVTSTGVIKDLVIVEESGIAKGIRRVIAYTGAAAKEAQLAAVEFGKQIDALEKMAFGPEKELEAKNTGVALSTLTVSAVTKDELRKRFEKITKEITDAQKKRQKVEAKTALEAVQVHFKKNEEANFFVGRLPISANIKAIGEVINHYKAKDKTRSVYIIAGNESGVAHGVYVGTELAGKGVTAEAWATKVSEVIGGKSGGKEPSRQGMGTKPESIDEGVETATKWLEEKLKL